MYMAATINIRDARSQFKALVDRAAAGEEIVLLRRDRPVARIVPPEAELRALPSLARFRASIRVAGAGVERRLAAVPLDRETRP